MKPFAFAFLTLAVLASSAFAEPMAAMTWNLRFDNPADGPNAWPKRKDWVARIVADNKVDIAGFQEVLAGQLADLKERLAEMDAYGVGRDDGKQAGEFSPIFYRKSRFEAIDRGTFWLSETPDKPGSKGWDAAVTRVASWLKLKDRQSGEVFYFLNTHFDHRGAKAKANSASMLVGRLHEQFADHPVILTGDLNSTPDSAAYKTLLFAEKKTRPAFLDSFEHSAKKPEGPASTWNGFKAIVPDARIDYVFTSGPIRVLRHRTLDERREGRFPSDHLPVVVELEIAR